LYIQTENKNKTIPSKFVKTEKPDSQKKAFQLDFSETGKKASFWCLHISFYACTPAKTALN